MKATLCSFKGCEQAGVWLHTNTGSLFCGEHYRFNLKRYDTFYCLTVGVRPELKPHVIYRPDEDGE